MSDAWPSAAALPLRVPVVPALVLRGPVDPVQVLAPVPVQVLVHSRRVARAPALPALQVLARRALVPQVLAVAPAVLVRRPPSRRSC